MKRKKEITLWNLKSSFIFINKNNNKKEKKKTILISDTLERINKWHVRKLVSFTALSVYFAVEEEKLFFIFHCFIYSELQLLKKLS